VSTEITDQTAAEMDLEQSWAAAMAHPDPDPDRLPDVIPPALLTEEQTAAHILRASLRVEASIAEMKQRMEYEMAAWGAELAKLTTRRELWRTLVRDWMLRHNVTQIKCPWFTASIAKGRTKIVVDDEERTIDILKRLPNTKNAVKVKESIVKAELDAIYNAIPHEFTGVVHTETGEPGLMVRKAKE
jgi:hypothetical protein